jgi:hypothetical protein
VNNQIKVVMVAMILQPTNGLWLTTLLMKPVLTTKPEDGPMASLVPPKSCAEIVPQQDHVLYQKAITFIQLVMQEHFLVFKI